MSIEKMVLLVTFSPPQLKATQEMRDWFASSYDRFLNMDAVEYKCWWVDQDKGQWGALYVFRSEEAVRPIWLPTSGPRLSRKSTGACPRPGWLRRG